jgi:glycosyltransferase involved in cell wall biosynthesis
MTFNDLPHLRRLLRVLFFDHTAALSGGEIALLHLVQAFDLKKIKPIVVLGAEGPLVEKLRPNVDTYVLSLPSGVAGTRKNTLGLSTFFRIRDLAVSFQYIFRLARFIREKNIDIVHTNSLKADILGGFAARLAGRPIIWHVRDRIAEDYLPSPIVKIFRLLAQTIPTRIIAVSDAVAATLRKNKDSDDRITVVHDGTLLPIEPIHHPQGASSSSPIRIGLIGRISPWKGQRIFLQAAAIVLKQFPDARFLIIGAPLFNEETYDQEIRSLAKQLGIQTSVEFTGFCSDIPQIISTLSLVVHASTTPEPFGQVIIEGMAAGKPVVATNGGGVPEIVEDGKTGILVPMGDSAAMARAICTLLENPQDAAAMGARARQRVENNFTVAATARRVEAVYAQIPLKNR